MSIFYLSHAWKIKDVTPSEKIILISLADQANDDGVCWPSVQTLSLRTALKERTVRKVINDLAEKGFLKINRRKGSSNYYDLTPALNAPLHDMHPSNKAPTPAPDAPPPAPDAPPPLHQMQGTPAPDAGRTQREPTVEPKENPNLAPGAIATDANVVEAELVDGAELNPESVSDEPRVEIPPDMPGPKNQDAKTFKAWANYAITYQRRYNVWPVWNARVAGQMAQLVDRLGKSEAPKVAAFYLSTNDARVINEQHSVGLLLARAESLRTQWLTGRRMNSTTARQQERTAANYEAAEAAKENIKRRSIYDNPLYKR